MSKSDKPDREPLIRWIEENGDKLKEQFQRNIWMEQSDPDLIDKARNDKDELDRFNNSWQQFQQNNLNDRPDKNQGTI